MSLLELARSAVPTADSTAAKIADAQRSGSAAAVTPCRHWRVYFNDGRPPLEVIFSDDQTAVAVRGRYSGVVQPESETHARPATAAEEAELCQLIAVVLHDGTDDDRQEALTVALRDVESALASYKALAEQRLA